MRRGRNGVAHFSRRRIHSTGLATIVDMQSLEIEVDVNESYIARVTPHQRVTATLDRIPVGRFRHTCERLFRRRTGKRQP